MPNPNEPRPPSALTARGLAARSDSRTAKRISDVATVTPLRRRTVTPSAQHPVRRTSSVPTRVRSIRTTDTATREPAPPRRTTRAASARTSSDRASSSGTTTSAKRTARTVASGVSVRKQRGGGTSGRLRVAAPKTPPPGRASVRMRWLVIAMVVVLCLLALRLVMVQVVNRDDYAARGTAQRKSAVALAAERGSIFDRNGTDLALSVPARTVYADPKLITDPVGTAEKVAPMLGLDVESVREKLARTDTRFVYIARKVDVPVAKAIEDLELPGIAFVDESKRYYPGGGLAAPVMGFVGTDNNGLSGLETAFDKQLTGTPGKLVIERDLNKREIPTSRRTEVPSVRGQDLVLTIDQTIQYEAERVLTEEVMQSKAKGGLALVADVQTGDLLAVVNINGATDTTPAKPAGPNDPNRTVTDVYEPGSTNKVITMAGAIEEGVTTPTTPYQVPMAIKIADATFEDSHPHGVMQWTTTDILRESSNVGSIMIGRQLGKDRLDHYLRSFGFGKTTSLGLPGESPGLLLDPKKYSGTSMGTVPTGNGLAVTAAQMLSVYMTVANNGTQVPMRLVDATIDGSGRREPTTSGESKRVISEATATQLRGMLAQVVTDGTGTEAAIPGYTVAGKTGTARKPPYDRPPYRYMASFAGFAPADNPRLAAIVILDEPQTAIFGGVVAAPAFSRMMAYALRAMKVPPNSAAASQVVANNAVTPVVAGTSASGATTTTTARTPSTTRPTPSTTRPRSTTVSTRPAAPPGAAPGRSNLSPARGAPPMIAPNG